MFEYEFMQKAFLAGIMLGVVVPSIGVIVVLKRLSMIGDALSHTSLAGVAAGLIGGINPVLGASIACIAAAFCVEGISRKFKGHAELAIAIVMSTGIGLAGVLSGFVPNAANFNSFLFGSIVTVSNAELYSIMAIGFVVLAFCVLCYKELFFIALDERSARLAGVPIAIINFLFILMTALTVSIAARTVGALIVSSMMVVPAACGLQLARSYRQMVGISCFVGVATTATGLVLSYYFGLRPGATIVLVAVSVLLIIFSIKHIAKLIRKQQLKSA